MIGLQAYKELDVAAKKLWEDLDDAILKPRTNLNLESLLSIKIKDVSVHVNFAGVGY